jgi:hypothetical protein
VIHPLPALIDTINAGNGSGDRGVALGDVVDTVGEFDVFGRHAAF